jgi:hypothetical protein
MKSLIILSIFLLLFFSVAINAQNFSLSFDGDNDSVDLGNILNDLDVPFTICAWIYIDSHDHAMIIFNTDYLLSPPPMPDYYGLSLALSRYASDGGTYQDSCILNATIGNGFGHTPANRRTKSGNTLLPSHQWQHVACVIRGATDMDIYINGENDGGIYTGYGGGTVHNEWPVMIGSNFNGCIDEVWVYERALNQEEIQLNMQYKYDIISETGLIGHWSFNEGEGDSVYDTSPHRYNGKVWGATWSTNVPSSAVQQISISIDTVEALPGDTICLPIRTKLPFQDSFSSLEINLQGFQNRINFMGVKTDNSSIGSAGWQVVCNPTDTLLYIAAAGANDISGQGVLLWLKFFVPDTMTPGFVPVQIHNALFNNGERTVEKQDGGLTVIHCEISAGDVDLNGEVRAFDAALILKYLVDLTDLDICQRANARTSEDNFLSALDAFLILQYVTGLIDTLPYDTRTDEFDASGNLALNDVNVRAGDVVNIPLVLINGVHIYALKIEFNYNPEDLTFIEIAWNETSNPFASEIKNENGKIKLVRAGKLSNIEYGELATLKFVVNENFNRAETYIYLHSLRWNENPVLYDLSTARLTNVSTVHADSPPMAATYKLEQNYPNPFNPVTTIAYQIPKSEFVSITIYDIAGHKVKELVKENQAAGHYSIDWNAGNLSSGLYFACMQAGNFKQITKMILLK